MWGLEHLRGESETCCWYGFMSFCEKLSSVISFKFYNPKHWYGVTLAGLTWPATCNQVANVNALKWLVDQHIVMNAWLALSPTEWDARTSGRLSSDVVRRLHFSWCCQPDAVFTFEFSVWFKQLCANNQFDFQFLFHGAFTCIQYETIWKQAESFNISLQLCPAWNQLPVSGRGQSILAGPQHLWRRWSLQE